MLTAGSAFALFLMLALSSVVYYVSKRLTLPYTVLLTFVGILLVPLSTLSQFDFIREFQLTPELLFFIFLPTLLFESAFQMNIRRVVDEFSPIILLSVVGYLASALLIGGGLWLAFDLINLTVPFLVTLLFGALISATDPVAVLALFKEFGAPRRLTLIFEGESLLNDATALALFVIVLGLMEAGLSTIGIALGGITFVTMLVGGVLLGFLVGFLLIQLIGVFKENEIVAITLMIVLAHSTFLLAELLNHEFQHFGLSFIQFSPIIATTAASLLMGNYGRFKVTPRANEFIEKFWSQFAFMANSLVFMLVGLLVASVPESAVALTVPVLIAVVIVALSRALSIYFTLAPFNIAVKKGDRIPLDWQHLLAWGSLRGALAVMLVLLIPPDLSIPGWTLALSVQEFLLILTVACIFVTLFIKAPTIGPMMRAFHIGKLTRTEEVASEEAQALIHGTTVLKLAAFRDKGYIPADIAERLIHEHEEKFRLSSEKCRGDTNDIETAALAERVLRLYIIGFEKSVLKELLTFDEITERVFKRIYSKLNLQYEAIEMGNLDPSGMAMYDHRDFFENIAEGIGSFIRGKRPEQLARNEYLYQRAQGILAQKVVKELARLSEDFGTPVFTKESLDTAKTIYAAYRARAQAEAEAVRKAHPKIIHALDEALAYRSIYRIEERYLDRFYHNEMLTPKLYIALKDEFEAEVRSHKIKH